MKCLRRCLSALLCCALLSLAFSSSVSADEVKDYNIGIKTQFITETTNHNYNMTVIPNNSETEKEQYDIDTGIPAYRTTGTVLQTFIIEYLDNSVILAKNRLTTISLHNAYVSAMVRNSGGSSRDRTIDRLRLLVFYADGSKVYIDDVTDDEPENNGFHNFTVEFTPENDVVKIEFIVYNELTIKNNTPVSTDTPVTLYAGEWGSLEYGLNFTQQSEEASLLGGVIEWLKNIKTGIEGVVSNIKNLPSKIWNFIEEGLVYLFLPDETNLVVYKDMFDELLEDRLGAVYQVTHLLFDNWNFTAAVSTADVVTIPEATIDLPDGNSFTFGGYEVDVVPDGFSFLATSIKTLTGIVCTIAFVNGLRKRYDEIMGVQ